MAAWEDVVIDERAKEFVRCYTWYRNSEAVDGYEVLGYVWNARFDDGDPRVWSDSCPGED